MDQRLPNQPPDDQNPEYPQEPTNPLEYPDYPPTQPPAPWQTPSDDPNYHQEEYYMPQEPKQIHPPKSAEKPPSSPPAAPPPFKKKGGILLRAMLGILLFIGLIALLWKTLPIVMPKQQENVELTYWGLGDDEAAMNEVIADFEKENPSIKVIYTDQDQAQYRERLIARMNNGTGPDIFRFHNSWVPMLAPLLTPLQDTVISANDLKNSYYPTVASDMNWNGSIVGVPLEMDTLALYINPEIFQAAGVQPPSSWDDFVSLAKQLTVRDQDGKIQTSGAAMGVYDNIDHASDILSLLFLQSGVNLKNISQATSQASDALQFYSVFASAGVWDTTLDRSTLAFANGKLAMYFGYYRDGLTINKLKAQNNSSMQYEVHPVPALPGQNMSVASYYAEGISSRSQHPKEAALLLAYLSRKDVLEKRNEELQKSRQYGSLYPRREMADLQKNDPLAGPFISQAQASVSTPFSGGTGDTGITAELNGYMANAIRSASSADSAVKALGDGEQQVFAHYGLAY